MSLLSLRNEGKVAIISMDNGKNANNLEFAQNSADAVFRKWKLTRTNKALIIALPVMKRTGVRESMYCG